MNIFEESDVYNIFEYYQKEIIKEYKKALTGIRSELMKLNEKMGAGITQEWQKYKYARDVELYRNINKELEKLGQRTVDLTDDLKKYTYKQGYYAGIYDIDKKTGFTFTVSNPTFANIPVTAFEGLVKFDEFLDVSHNPRLILGNFPELIKSAINQGLIRGKGVGEIAKVIKKEIGVKTWKAVQVAQTETLRATNKGALDSYAYAEQNGVKIRKKWLHGVVTFRTKRSYVNPHPYEPRPEHEQLNNTYADVEGENGEMYFELKSGEDKGALALAPGQFGIARQDIYCSCAISAETVDYKPPVMPEGINKDFSNFNSWYKDKVGSEIL